MECCLLANTSQPRFSTLLTRSFVVPVLIVFSLFLDGCSVGEYLGAYFNTYYNAQRDFTEAETELLSQQDPKKAEKAYLAPYTVPAAAKTKFTSVIEKCSKLLQYHSESSLVDEALLMIGKSYYYQNDLQQAERKFRELTDQFPEGDLFLEGKLLLANTLYRSSSLTDAQSLANELLDVAIQKNEDDIAFNAAMLLATIELDARNLIAAREKYQAAADHAPSNKDRFTALMKVAELSTTLGEFAPAEKAYRDASDASTTYLEDYYAKIGLARTQSRLGLYEESLDLMDDLLGNNNHREHFGEVEFEVANVYREMNDIEAAIDQYRYVDTTYARTEYSAKSYYELGLLYEKDLLQYDSARVAYGKGKTEAPQAAVTPLLAERSGYMDRYASLHSELVKNDSLKHLILFPPVQTDTHSVRGHASDSLMAMNQDSARQGTTVDSTLAIVADSLGHNVGDSTLAGTDSAAVVRFQPVTIPLDTVNARLALAKSELASLFYISLDVADSASYWYVRLVTDHPGSPFEPQALYSLAQLYSRDSLHGRIATDSLYGVLVDKYPRSEFAEVARKTLGLPAPEIEVDVAAQEYLEAEKLRNDGKYRNAITSLRSIVKKYPESPTASKALFALGWMYENVTPNADSALSNYSQVVSLFPATEYARVAKTKIDAVELHKRGEQEQATADSLKNVEPQAPAPGKEQMQTETDSTNLLDRDGLMREEGEVIMQEEPVANPDSLKKPDP